MSWTQVEAQSLEEGNEILLSPNTGETGIVEDVAIRWTGIGNEVRTIVTLVDGRSFRLRPEYPVRVAS